jgi:hypothetical protein
MKRQPEREQLNRLTVKTLDQVFTMRAKEGLGCSPPNLHNDQNSRNPYGFKGMVYSNRFVSPGPISNAGLV